jgi:DNA-binding response OmpR family regulator
MSLVDRATTTGTPPSVWPMPGTVLVVEDDALIASSLVRALDANGYDASATGSVASAIAAIDAAPPDLVLLDLGLPDGDGSEVAAHAAREHPTVPVIVLTARDSEVDVVLGLEAGAVDYVTKPFRLAELLARIASHLRMRDAHAGQHTRPAASQVIRLGDLELDVAARRLTLAGAEVPVRPKEFDVLRVLAEAAGAVVTREHLIEAVWDENWWGSTKTLDVHINSVRRKLGEQAGEPSRITTIRGVGYRLERERPSA